MRTFVMLVVGFILAVGPRLAMGKAEPPEQPAGGPGGRDYAHAAVSKYRFGEGEGEFWVFLPENPRPAIAPVVLFLHGWSAVNPKIYGAWIEHLVRRGKIVIYPRYQADNRTPPRAFTPNALSAAERAFAWLKREAPVRPNLERFAIVGHSAGGNIAANLAALAISAKFPSPRALMVGPPLMPGLREPVRWMRRCRLSST